MRHKEANYGETREFGWGFGIRGDVLASKMEVVRMFVS